MDTSDTNEPTLVTLDRELGQDPPVPVPPTDAFRDQVMLVYNVTFPGMRQTMEWCVVSGCWLSDVVAAPIIPSNHSEAMIDYICGERVGGRLSTPKNALPLSKAIKFHFDMANLNIVPTETATGHTVFRVQVMAAHNTMIIFNHQGTVGPHPIALLHDRELSFHHDYRPSKRFVYFRYLLNNLFFSMFAIEGTHHLAFHALMHFPIWPRTGRYFRKSFLLFFARHMAFTYHPDIQPQPDDLMDRLEPHRLGFQPIWPLHDYPQQEQALSKDVFEMVMETIIRSTDLL